MFYTQDQIDQMGECEESVEICKKTGEMPLIPMYPPNISGIDDPPDLIKVIFNALGEKL
jgi:hypothetical protein